MVVRLSALRTGRLYHQERHLVLISVRELSRPQGHSAAGRIISLKNSNDTIGNRTRDPPVCSVMQKLVQYTYYFRNIHFHSTKLKQLCSTDFRTCEV